MSLHSDDLRLTLAPPGQHSFHGERIPSAPPGQRGFDEEATLPFALKLSPPRGFDEEPTILFALTMSPPRGVDEEPTLPLALTMSPPAHSQQAASSVEPEPEGSRVKGGQTSVQAASSVEPEPEGSRVKGGQTSVDRPDAKVKEELIPPPYAWATDRRAVVYSLDRIIGSGISSIQGEVICKRCDGTQIVDINLQASFLQLDTYFMSNKGKMHDRAPKIWMVPCLLDCTMCHQKDCVKPVINPRKRNINWLFLVLSGTLGLCTLDQLKYFCKHTHKHRTGAKDRVLFATYKGLLEQLNPEGHYG